MPLEVTSSRLQQRCTVTRSRERYQVGDIPQRCRWRRSCRRSCGWRARRRRWARSRSLRSRRPSECRPPYKARRRTMLHCEARGWEEVCLLGAAAASDAARQQCFAHRWAASTRTAWIRWGSRRRTRARASSRASKSGSSTARTTWLPVCSAHRWDSPVDDR